MAYQYPIVNLLTATTISLLTTTETKNWLKVDHSVDDTLIGLLIKAAQGYIENETGITLFESTWEQKQVGGVEEIELLKEPTTQINSVTFYGDFDSTGTVLVSNTDYRLVEPKYLIPPNIVFDEGRPYDGYVINFVAGKYTSTVSTDDEFSASIKAAALKFVGWIYENREEYLSEVQEGLSVKYDYTKVPQTIVRMLRPYSVKVGL